MGLYSHICAFCSQACLNHQLRKLNKDFKTFINSFIHDCDEVFYSLLRICKFCLDKLRDFQLFIKKSRTSFDKLALIRKEHVLENRDLFDRELKREKINESNNLCMENCIEIFLHESNNIIEHINNPTEVENSITITEVTIDDEGQNKGKRNLHKVDKKLDTKYYNKTTKEKQPCELYCDTQIHNQIKPLDLTKYQENKIIDTKPDSERLDDNDSQASKQIMNQSVFHSQYQSLQPNERKKVRNREASRRYRERARQDPELLLRIREQQKKRQKKYYNKIRKIDKKANEI